MKASPDPLQASGAEAYPGYALLAAAATPMTRRGRRPLFVLLCFAAWRALCPGRAAESQPVAGLIPEAVQGQLTAGGLERLVIPSVSGRGAPAASGSAAVVFHAVLAREWPEGLIPLYA